MASTGPEMARAGLRNVEAVSSAVIAATRAPGPLGAFCGHAPSKCGFTDGLEQGKADLIGDGRTRPSPARPIVGDGDFAADGQLWDRLRGTDPFRSRNSQNQLR